MKTMALYLIGDIQGCDGALQNLLNLLDFSPSRDTLFVLGDLVNRGLQSDAVLRRMMRYGSSARCILGNHDLHLLAIAHSTRQPDPTDSLNVVLQAPDRDAMLQWLIQQPLARLLQLPQVELLMVHAGVVPQWDLTKTLALAREVQSMLADPQQADDFFKVMYGNTPTRWDDSLTGNDRWRAIINALTRIRFCTPDGEMEFKTKEGATSGPPGFIPWFEAPDRATRHIGVAFGHWSTLGWLKREGLYSLDTGCVWGGALTALKINESGGLSGHERLQVQCEMVQQPGI
jgi:bis(5'-nucleosyl)-tetraphosphatase (symmetrical)